MNKLFQFFKRKKFITVSVETKQRPRPTDSVHKALAASVIAIKEAGYVADGNGWVRK